jgi:thiamine pyrophosphate-dependent acetolactate synthase large subunit-like protein
MNDRPGYEVVAEAVLAAGVRTAFGLLGNTNVPMATDLALRGVRFVGSRHESAAVSAAAGYAWATGAPAFCTVTHGPGLANALTALTSAVRDRLPVVLLVADIRAAPRWSAQRADQQAMVGWTGARFVHCHDPAGLAASVAEAFAEAAAARVPVVLELRAGLLEAPAPGQRPQERVVPVVADPTTPPAAELEAAADVLLAARRPVVLGGRGALWADAGAALRELAAAWGAVLATTLHAKGLFAGDPFDAGVAGGYSRQTTRDLLTSADCVLVVGAGLNGYTDSGGALLAGARIVQCDLEPAAFGRYRSVDVALLGDARATAEALTLLLREAAAPPRGLRTPELADALARDRNGADDDDLSGPDGLDPRVVLRRLDRLLPPDRQVAMDVGHFSTFPSQLLSVPEGGRLLAPFGFGSVGLGIAAGLGAALGRPVPTVVVIGDGGTLMSLGELETVARIGLPLTVVVLNDAAYAAEVHHLRHHGLPEGLARFPDTDLAAVATALGVTGLRVESAAELDLLQELVPAGGPVLLDVRITDRVVSDRFRHLPRDNG